MLPFLLAALLGAGSALLTACGAGTEAGIPAAQAGTLRSQITDVEQAVEDGRCSDVPGQVRQVDEGIDDLPPSVDDQLVNSLRDGANKLLGLAREECDDARTETTTTETTQTTETPPETETVTTPAETTTTEEPPTETIEPEPQPPPPPVEPEPDPAQPQPPPPPPPPPPSGTPGGGVEPVIP